VSARDAILASVRASRLAVDDRPIDAPDVVRASRSFGKPLGDMLERFTAAARATAVDVNVCTRSELPSLIATWYPDARVVASMVDGVSGSRIAASTDPHMLSNTDLFVCEAEFGVAENGALWLTDARLGQRAALFLATDVLIVLLRHTVVDDLHRAYARVDLSSIPFGIFVAGPSKTADIEQSLVIGAHGPKSVRVAIVD
jgi:L-lactate dehydrogenase complex protein LldG